MLLLGIIQSLMKSEIFVFSLLITLLILGCTSDQSKSQLSNRNDQYLVDSLCASCLIPGYYWMSDSIIINRTTRLVDSRTTGHSIEGELVFEFYSDASGNILFYQEWDSENNLSQQVIKRPNGKIRIMSVPGSEGDYIVFQKDSAQSHFLSLNSENLLVSHEMGYGIGVLTGWATHWYENGNILSHGCFQCGKAPYVQFHPNGIVAIQGTAWGSNMYFVGDYKEYYDSGQLKLWGSFNNPLEINDLKRIGKWKEYNREGQLSSKSYN